MIKLYSFIYRKFRCFPSNSLGSGYSVNNMFDTSWPKTILRHFMWDPPEQFFFHSFVFTLYKWTKCLISAKIPNRLKVCKLAKFANQSTPNTCLQSLPAAVLHYSKSTIHCDINATAMIRSLLRQALWLIIKSCTINCMINYSTATQVHRTSLINHVSNLS